MNLNSSFSHSFMIAKTKKIQHRVITFSSDNFLLAMVSLGAKIGTGVNTEQNWSNSIKIRRY